MAGREISRSLGVAINATPFPWEAIQELNERSFELLVQVARSEADRAILPPSLRELLRESSPEGRKSAAARAYLLLDLEFRNLLWWEAVRRSPERPFAGQTGRIPLPKRAAISLARTLLMTTREAIRADAAIARLLLGIDAQVAELLSGLQIADIDRIAEHQFRHVEPRWLDRPAVWRSLLLPTAEPASVEKRQFDTRCLQLLIGETLPNSKARQL